MIGEGTNFLGRRAGLVGDISQRNNSGSTAGTTVRRTPITWRTSINPIVGSSIESRANAIILNKKLFGLMINRRKSERRVTTILESVIGIFRPRNVFEDVGVRNSIRIVLQAIEQSNLER
jgi:hypothetical protein